MKRLLSVGAIALALSAALALPALAQTADGADIANGLLDLACSTGGRGIVMVLLVPAIAWVIGLGANFRTRLPRSALLLLDLIGGNFAKSFRPAAKMLALCCILGAVASLSACGGSPAPKPTGDMPADLKSYVTFAQTTSTKVEADIKKDGSVVAANAITVGTDACGAAMMLHTIYTGPLGQIAVALGGAAISSATGAPPISAAAADLTEAVVFKEVQAACTILAAAKAGAITPETITAAKTVVAALPKLRAAIAKVSPEAAQLIAPAT